jgi:hypothetical protein
MSNAGVILVFKWDGRQFIFWKECTDPTFLNMILIHHLDPEAFIPGADIQAGYLLVQDATGLGLNDWNLVSQSDLELKKFKGLQENLMQYDDVFYGIPFWSYSGKKILFSLFDGPVFEFECKL